MTWSFSTALHLSALFSVPCLVNSLRLHFTVQSSFSAVLPEQKAPAVTQSRPVKDLDLMPLTHLNEDCLAQSWAVFSPVSHALALANYCFPSGSTLCCNITKIKVTFLGTGGVLQTWKSLHHGLKIHKSVCSFTELFTRSLCQYVLELQGFFVAILQEASDDGEPLMHW